MTQTYYDKQYPRSVYSLGAEDGLWIGLMMGACMLMMIVSANHPFIALPALILVIATPYATWLFLRRRWVERAVPSTLSAVWLHGICIFLFGSLIMALITYISLRYIEPDWILNQTLRAAERLAQEPSTANQSRALLKIVESGQLPTPIYTAISAIWLVAFSGSMWSLIFATVLTRTRHFIDLRAAQNS